MHCFFSPSPSLPNENQYFDNMNSLIASGYLVIERARPNRYTLGKLSDVL